MPSIRDIQLKQRAKFAAKQDALPYIRAVITDAFGNQSGSGSIWFNESERRVWYMALGSNQPAQCRCVRITPSIGLGVIIGNTQGTPEKEVLSDDPFLRASNTTSTSFVSPTASDFEPGGRLQLWLYTKMIVPLSTYPTGGMNVNVVEGDYPYAGARLTFGGDSVDLTASIPANPNEHRLVGLYLDTSNTLQTVNGTAVSTALIAPEPTWPAGFRLCVILIANGDTSVDFANLSDRRMVWSDESGGGGNVWPKPDKINIGATEYSTLADAAAAAIAGDLIKIGEGDFAIASRVFIDNFQVDVIGSGVDITTITTTAAAGAFNFGQGTLKDMTITSAENDGIGVRVGTLDVCKVFNLFVSVAGTGTMIGVYSASATDYTDCVLSASGGTENYGLFCASGDVTFNQGEIVGDIYVNTNRTVTLNGTVWSGAKAGAGTLTGWWVDANGRVFSRYHRHFQLMGA